MRNQSLSAGVLLLALLLSTWGNVLAAALCPHLKQDHSCCPAQVSHDSAHHEMADDMQMSGMEMPPAAAQETKADVVSRPVEACAHCVGHSQAPTLPLTPGGAAPTNHSRQLAAPLAVSPLGSRLTLFGDEIVSRPHAPPERGSSARHILIGVFRI